MYMNFLNKINNKKALIKIIMILIQIWINKKWRMKAKKVMKYQMLMIYFNKIIKLFKNILKHKIKIMKKMKAKNLIMIKKSLIII